ncbi:MAG: glycosyltransferase family 4 protein [Desulfurococcaceae archaeon]
MRLLVLTSRIPYPWWFYGVYSIYSLVKHLKNKGVDILLSFPVNSVQMNRENIEHLISIGLKVLPFEMDTSDKIYRILLNIGSKTPFKWQKYFSEQYLVEIEKWIKKHGVDIIQVHTPHMSKYALKLREQYDMLSILRVQDINFNQVKSFMDLTSNPLEKLIAYWQYRKTLKIEPQVWKNFEKVVFITKQDYIQAKSIVEYEQVESSFTYIYDGVDIKENKWLKTNPKKKAFCFAASDQIQNILSLKWFINKIWKQIYKDLDYEFHIYGAVCNFFKDKSAELASMKIKLCGFIEDVDELENRLSDYAFFLSPTVVGSGYRTKILQMGAIGMPIICTRFDYLPFDGMLDKNEDILVFEKAEDFWNIVNNPYLNDMLRKVSVNIHNKISSKFRWERVAEEFIKIYEEVLNKRR